MTGESLSRRAFFQGISLVGVAALGVPSLTTPAELRQPGSKPATDAQSIETIPISENNRVSDEINEEKIRRARFAGPAAVTGEATVADLGHGGALTVLRKGTNHWVCVPGDENLIGQADMCLDPMGMQWMLDVMARKPKPTNATPGLIYMPNGAMSITPAIRLCAR